MTFFCYLLMALVTICYCLAGILPFVVAVSLCAFSRKLIGRITRFAILFYGKSIVHIALRPFAKVDFEDMEPEQDRGIYICNHRSASDPFLVSVITRRPAAQAVNRWPMRLPFFGFFAVLGEYMDVTAMDYEEIRKHSAYLIGQGAPLIIFPEGTRSGNGEINQFHSTFFRVAKDLSCPIIPVAIVGNEHIPSRDFRITCGHIRIRKLPQIAPELIHSLSPFQLKNHVRSPLKKETAAMDKALERSPA